MHQGKHTPVKFDCRVTVTAARRQANLFKALADPYRLRIIDLLYNHEGRITVFDIVESLDKLEQPSVSHHLRILRDAGLVDFHKVGLNVYYFVQYDVLTEAYSAIYRERQEKSA